MSDAEGEESALALFTQTEFVIPSRSEEPRFSIAGSTNPAPCPILSPFLRRQGGKPQISPGNGRVPHPSSAWVGGISSEHYPPAGSAFGVSAFSCPSFPQGICLLQLPIGHKVAAPIPHVPIASFSRNRPVGAERQWPRTSPSHARTPSWGRRPQTPARPVGPQQIFRTSRAKTSHLTCIALFMGDSILAFDRFQAKCPDRMSPRNRIWNILCPLLQIHASLGSCRTAPQPSST